MPEYISREAAFDAVFGQFCASSDETEAALNAAIDEIKRIPAADVRPRWISVEERLPENGQVVLCYWWNVHCCERDNLSVMRFRKGRTAEELKDAKCFSRSDQWGNNKKPYCWDDPHGPLSLFGQEVTHWMELPEPPKEET